MAHIFLCLGRIKHYRTKFGATLGSVEAIRSLSLPDMHTVPLSSPRSVQSLFLITSLDDDLTCKH